MSGVVEWETESQSVQLSLEESTEPKAEPANVQEATCNWPDGFALEIARATRTWVQYGMLGFAVVCIVIGAVKGLLGL